MRTLLILLSSVAIATAIQCYVGQATFSTRQDQFYAGNNQGGLSNVPGMQVQFCPADVRFCYKSYVRRNNDGDSSYTETRSCGDVQTGKCFEDGCDGPGHNKQCCCSDDLCNVSTRTAGSVVIGILALLSFF